MNYIFNYKSTEKEAGLEDYAKAKLDAVNAKYSNNPMKVEFTFHQVKLEKIVHLHYVAEHGQTLEVTERAETFMQCLDKIHDVIDRNLRKEKEKTVSKKVKEYKAFVNQAHDEMLETAEAPNNA